MRESNRFKIILVMFFTITLFSSNQVYGMFNEEGQWVCSREIEIEISYYEFYTDTFQNAINEVYLDDGAKAAQSYFEFAIEDEATGQDWKRSQDCLIRLGIDTIELSPIVIPREEIPPVEEIPPREEYFETESIDDSYYVGVVIIIIIAIVGFTFFSFKSRKKYRDSKTIARDYGNNDEKREEQYENIEIEIKGGIEK